VAQIPLDLGVCGRRFLIEIGLDRLGRYRQPAPCKKRKERGTRLSLLRKDYIGESEL
jgi:hypothetical protein